MRLIFFRLQHDDFASFEVYSVVFPEIWSFVSDTSIISNEAQNWRCIRVIIDKPIDNAIYPNNYRRSCQFSTLSNILLS